VVLNKLFGGMRKPFLEISKTSTTPVVVAPVQEASTKEDSEVEITAPTTFKIGPVATTPTAPTAKPIAKLKPEPKSKSKPEPNPSAAAAVLTTAQLLAAERAEELATEKVQINQTFAAELLNPASALPKRRRRPGAALSGFKEMAKGIRP
jgi:hypothetical protein